MVLKVTFRVWTQSVCCWERGIQTPHAKWAVIFSTHTNIPVFKGISLCVEVAMWRKWLSVSRTLCRLQPENIVLARDGSSTIKLVDFGSARDLSMEKKGSALTIVGTPEFVGECICVWCGCGVCVCMVYVCVRCVFDVHVRVWYIMYVCMCVCVRVGGWSNCVHV